MPVWYLHQLMGVTITGNTLTRTRDSSGINNFWESSEQVTCIERLELQFACSAMLQGRSTTSDLNIRAILERHHPMPGNVEPWRHIVIHRYFYSSNRWRAMNRIVMAANTLTLQPLLSMPSRRDF